MGLRRSRLKKELPSAVRRRGAVSPGGARQREHDAGEDSRQDGRDDDEETTFHFGVPRASADSRSPSGTSFRISSTLLAMMGIMMTARARPPPTPE